VNAGAASLEGLRPSAKYLWGYSGPALLVTIVLVLFPLAYALWASFYAFSYSSDVPQWVGYNNYLRVLTDGDLRSSLASTAAIVLPALAIEVLLGLGLALAVNSVSRGRAILTTILALPVMISGGALGMTFRMLFTPQWGPVDNAVTRIFGVGSIDWLGNAALARMAVVLADVWQNTPFVMLICLAALAAIPEQIREASSVDGATSMQRFRFIEFPLIAKFLLVATLFRLIDLFRIFDVVFVMTGGGPASATETISYYIYRQGIRAFDVGYAVVLGVVLALVMLVVCIGLIRLVGRRGQ